MGLENILSIAGKGGLFKLVGQMKNGVIVESIVDGKKTPAQAHNRISALADISIYGEEEERPLARVIKDIVKKFDGNEVPFKKWSGEELRGEFAAIFPDYDVDRVYASDLKKIYQWTNLLLAANLIDLTWANSEDEAKSDEEVVEKAD